MSQSSKNQASPVATVLQASTDRQATFSRRFCVAPMMQLTDRHDRYLLRLLSKRALLYTEMVTAEAILNGPRDRLLEFSPAEHPVALQIGGSDPAMLARCASIAEQWQYDEVNLNVGCPSDRVQSGRFGACLMLEPALVSDCFQAMQSNTKLPITVKCRIGVDEQKASDCLPAFIETMQDAGCRTLIIHARKAWLNGLSPKENRDIPPLDYALVYAMKKHYPTMEVILNGGIESLAESELHLQHLDGVMLGRRAYHEPWILAGVDEKLFDDKTASTNRTAVFEQYLRYIDTEIARGNKLHHMARHILGLFHGVAGARQFRRYLSENMFQTNADSQVLREAHSLLHGPR